MILLDVMLPDGDGRDFAADVRKGSDVPIIMLTARGEEIDRVLGLELGADDYVVKPFSARELIARIRAIMRRGKLADRRGELDVGEITISIPAARIVTKTGERDRVGGSRVRSPAPIDGARGAGRAPRADHGRGLGLRTGSGRRRRSMCTSRGSARRSRMTHRTPLHHDDPRRRVPVRDG